MSGTIQTVIPDQLWQQAQTLARQGWASNMDEIINESLRLYLKSHQDVLTEAFIKDDVEWGLNGED